MYYVEWYSTFNAIPFFAEEYFDFIGHCFGFNVGSENTFILKVGAVHHDLFSALQSGFPLLEFSSRARWECLFHMDSHMSTFSKSCAIVTYSPIAF